MHESNTIPSSSEHSENTSASLSNNMELIDSLFANNPGPYEDLHKKTKDVSPIIFEGFKFNYTKPLSSHFHVSHTVILGSVVPSGYKFGATFIGTKQLSPVDMTPIILGDIDVNGNMNGQMIHQFNRNVKTRIIAQIQESELAGYQATTDYKGRDFTASISAIQNDIVKKSGIFVGQYLQRVTKNLDLGSELVFQYGKQVPNGRTASFTLGGRYFREAWQISGALNPGGSLHLCYHRQEKLSPLQFGLELESSLRTGESVCTFNYQVDLNKANVTFKGMADSNFNVGAVMEKRLSQTIPFSLMLSGFLNHVKASYKFGIGFNMGS